MSTNIAEPGFDPGTFGLWAQHANHCATPLLLKTWICSIYVGIEGIRKEGRKQEQKGTESMKRTAKKERSWTGGSMKKHWVLLAMPPLQNVGTVDWSWCVGLKTQRPLGSALYTKAEHQTKANKPATQQKQQTHNSQKTTNPQNQQIHSPTKKTSNSQKPANTKAKYTPKPASTQKTTNTQQKQQAHKTNKHKSKTHTKAWF